MWKKEAQHEKLTILNHQSSCAHECCKIGKRRKGKSSTVKIAKTGSVSANVNDLLSTTSCLAPDTFTSEQLYIPPRYRRPAHSTHRQLSGESTSGPQNSSSLQNDNGLFIATAEEWPVQQDVVSTILSTTNHTQGGGTSSTCDLATMPSSVHSSTMNTSNVLEHSAYSFENPEISLREFDDRSTLPEQPAIVLPESTSSTGLNFAHRISKQLSEEMELNEFEAFQQWLEDCVDIIAD